MSLSTIVTALIAPQPAPHEEWTSRLPGARKSADDAVRSEPALPFLRFLQYAFRFGAREAHFEIKARTLTFRASCARPARLSEAELLNWWWVLLTLEGEAWLALADGGQIHLLEGDANRVVTLRETCPAPSSLEFQARLPEKGSPVLSHGADLAVHKVLLAGLSRVARFYPIPIYINGVLWEWPLDFKLVSPCAFSSYDLVRGEEEPGFAVAHPWVHGCRYWLTSQGDILDLVNLGAKETADAPGNICHIPALEGSLKPQRRLGLLRKNHDPGIDLSQPRTWTKSSYLPGQEEYLLSVRTVVFGSPPVKLQMRPLRVRELFLQTDQHTNANLILPIREGLQVEPIFSHTRPGGLTAVVVCPLHLETASQDQRIPDSDVRKAWVSQVLARGHGLQKALTES